MWMIRRIAFVAAIVGLLPVVLAGIAFTLAWLFECPVTESGLAPCIALSADIGEIIGSLLIVSTPGMIMLSVPAAALIVGWASIELIHFVRSR